MRIPATPEMVLETTAYVCATLDDGTRHDWEQPAGPVEWTCRATLDHMGDGLLWHSTQLAARASGLVHSSRSSAWPDASVEQLFVALPPLAAVLAEVVRAAPADARAWHGFGIADPEGFCAMACAEMLAHGGDIAQGLGIAWDPPPNIVRAALARLFPDVVLAPDDDPWVVFRWAHGRGDAPGRARRDENWRWHAAPLD